MNRSGWDGWFFISWFITSKYDGWVLIGTWVAIRTWITNSVDLNVYSTHDIPIPFSVSLKTPKVQYHSSLSFRSTYKPGTLTHQITLVQNSTFGHQIRVPSQLGTWGQLLSTIFGTWANHLGLFPTKRVCTYVVHQTDDIWWYYLSKQVTLVNAFIQETFLFTS